MFTRSNSFNQRVVSNKQNGSALVVALIVLMVLTVLGVTTISMTSLEERMAFNSQDRYLSLYSSEAITTISTANTANFPTMQSANPIAGPFPFTPAEIPSIRDGRTWISYVTNGSASNLPLPNRDAGSISQGGGNDAPMPIYEIYAASTTNAGTTAVAREYVYYYNVKD